MSIAYVDEPSAWRVPVAGFLVNFFVIGTLKSGGILLIAYQEIIDIGATALVLAPITISAATGILAPVAELVARYLTSRLVLCLSGVFLCFVYSSASFFLTSHTFYPLIGVCTGIGFALSYCPAISFNGLCFKKRRATAVGVCFSGASVGSMVMPLLLTSLLNVLPVRSFLPILGAIFLNICVAGVLLPTKIFDRSTDTFVLDQRLCSCCLKQLKFSTSSSHIKKKGVKTGDTVIRALLRALPFICSMMFTNFSYITQFFAVTLFANEFYPFPYFIAGLLTLQGVMDLATRLLSGVISDKLSSQHKALFCALSVVTQGVLVLLLALFPSKAMFWVYSVIFASSGAVTMTLWTVVLLTIVGRKKFRVFISLCYMIMGIFNLPMGFLVGLLRNINGSFREVLFMCAAMQLTSGVFNIFLSCLWKCVSAPEEKPDVTQLQQEDENQELAL